MGGVGKYAPFKMAAADHGNSPIDKNFGSPAHRGFNIGGLIGGEPGKPHAKTGVGSGLNYAAVGSSPAKGWWKKLKSKVKDVATGKGVLGAIVNPVGAIMRKTGMGPEEQAPAEAAAGGIAEAGAAQAVPMHGEESHTGGAGPVGSAIEGGMTKSLAGSGEGIDPAKLEKLKAASPKFGRMGGAAGGTVA